MMDELHTLCMLINFCSVICSGLHLLFTKPDMISYTGTVGIHSSCLECETSKLHTSNAEVHALPCVPTCLSL